MSQRNQPLFSQKDFVNFVRERLKIDVGDDRDMELLNKITLATFEHLPFNNISHMCQPWPASTRTAPTIQEAIVECLEGRGGMCWVMNCFFYKLLEALGYNTYLVLCSVHRPGTKDHAAVVVQDLEKAGDKYLVDVGFGYPSFKAISLDFDTESPIWTQSFGTFKYTKHDGNHFIRHHLSKEKTKEDSEQCSGNKVWTPMYFFECTPCCIHQIQTSIENSAYKDPTSIFNTSFRAIRFPDGEAVAVNSTTLLTEENDGKLTSHEMTSDQEIIEALKHVSPFHDVSDIRQCVLRWKELQNMTDNNS